MQHEPVGDVDGDGKEAELAHGHYIDEIPDDGQGEDVRERREEDFQTASTESETYTLGYRVVERDGKDRFRLEDVSASRLLLRE